MSEQDPKKIIPFPQTSETRARAFKITAPVHNFLQYVRAVKTHISARMTLQNIVNAAILLNDPVEIVEIDALLQESWQKKQSEVAEDPNKILAWQNRGEMVSVKKLPFPTSDGEMVLVSKELEIPTFSGEIPVIEGIAVFRDSGPAALLENSDHDAELLDSPFLKKAA